LRAGSVASAAVRPLALGGAAEDGGAAEVLVDDAAEASGGDKLTFKRWTVLYPWCRFITQERTYIAGRTEPLPGKSKEVKNYAEYNCSVCGALYPTKFRRVNADTLDTHEGSDGHVNA
jgi:hypothetical protein